VYEIIDRERLSSRFNGRGERKEQMDDGNFDGWIDKGFHERCYRV